MADPLNSLFNQLKRPASLRKETGTGEPLKFVVAFDDHGAYLDVVDKKGHIIQASYMLYAGAERNLLRTLEQIKEKDSFVINWEKPTSQVYLAEHPYLIEILRLIPNLTDKNQKKLSFTDTPGRFRLEIGPDEGDNLLHASILLFHTNNIFKNFNILTEDFVLAEGQIIEVPHLGHQFNLLSLFNTTFYKEQCTLFLSLVYSHLDHLELKYENYNLQVKSGSIIKAKSCLIIEKVDEQNTLFLRVGQILPELNFSDLEEYDITRYAAINAMDETITIQSIDQEPIDQLTDNIHKLLKKHKTGSTKKSDRNILIDGNLMVIPEETAASFIYNELPNILETYTLFGAEKLKSYKINTNLPKLRTNLSSGIDYFEGDVDLDFNGERITLFDALHQYHKNRYIQLSDGTHSLLNEAYVRRLERIFKKKGKTTRLSFFDLPLIEELLEEVAQEKVFERSRNVFEGFNGIRDRKNKLPKLGAKLRPYQLQGFHWLSYLHEQQLGGCLADDMGLGKTLQTIALLATIYPKEKSPTLIVMPRSLIFNWQREVERFAPQLTTYTFYGQSREYKALRDANLVFTTYATMRNEIEHLEKEPFYYVILDESQNIKNINTQTAKAAMILQGKYRLALSGTPIENNLGELFSLFHFLNPAMFGSATQFNTDYLNPIQKNQDNDATIQLRRKIYPFILRRLKKDVLSELPDKTEQTLYVEMTPGQKTLYEQRRQYFAEMIKSEIKKNGILKSQFFIFQAMNELRQIATIPEVITEGKVSSAKLDFLMEQLTDTIANGHKALIFVNFLGAIESISEGLQSLGIDFVSMTGATRDRQILVDKFQSDANCRVFLMTLKTGGVGLNLTAADTIFIYDPWWNVAAENQAIDRAHRIGQLNKVLAYKMIVMGTIEEKIIQLQQVKKALFDNIISADGASLKSLTEDDIQILLGK